MKDAFGVERVSKSLKDYVAYPGRPPSKSDLEAARPHKLRLNKKQMKAAYDKSVSKKDDKRLHPAAVGAATAGGALAGQSAYMMVTPLNNHVLKPRFARKMAEKGPDSPEAKIWREWNKPPQHFRGGEKPDLVRPLTRRQAEKEAQSNTKRAAWHGSKEFHRKFPKGLPGWRLHRALSYAGKGLSGHATAATAMGLGAFGAYKVATRKPKQKVEKGLPSIARGTGYRSVTNPEAAAYLRSRMVAHDRGKTESKIISLWRNDGPKSKSTLRLSGGLKIRSTAKRVPIEEPRPLRGGDGAESMPRKTVKRTRVVDRYADGTTSVIDRVEGKPTYYIRSKIGKRLRLTEIKKWGYVPKSQMTPKLLLQDPGFLAPVAGVTLAGAGGTALAARKYKKRKKK